MDIANWNEHIFFEVKNKETDELERCKIAIKLMDKGFYKDALIGYYEFDLTYLYQQKNHALMHKWIILTNPEAPEDRYGEVTGQLKLSITVTGEGDPTMPIEDDPNPEKEEIVQSPSVKPEFYQVHFKFFTAQRIVPLDTTFGKDSSDVFIRLDYKTSKLKTTRKVIYRDGEVAINEEFWVPAQLPLVGGRIVFRVYDYNTGIPDEMIGSMHIELKDILPDRNNNPGRLNNMFDWKQVYGSPLGVSGKMTDTMNQNPEVASLWKGRILMQCTHEKTQKPKLMKKKLPADEINAARKYLDNRQFAARVFIGQIMNTPFKDTAYQVEVRIADKAFVSKECPNPKKKYNRINQIVDEKEGEFMMPYLSLKDIGTIYVYLRKEVGLIKKEWKRVCFWKGNIMDFADPNPKLKWIEFLPDLAIGEVK